MPASGLANIAAYSTISIGSVHLLLNSPQLVLIIIWGGGGGGGGGGTKVNEYQNRPNVL